jgi:hypothetical protein
MNLTYRNIIVLRAALSALEGRERTIEAKGQTQVVVKPFKFSGQTRLKIARNLRAGEAAFQEYEAARVGLVHELAEGGDKVPEAKLPEFSRRLEELQQAETDITLSPLAEAELNLEDNEIPHGALAVLLEFLLNDPKSN